MTRTNPRRSEIWLVELNPTRGQEIQKTRPAIIVSTNLFQGVPLRIVVPVTSWQAKFEDRLFMIQLIATPETGLERDSAANVLQVRSVSTDRMVRRLGQVSPAQLQEILAGLVVCVEYEQAV
jgi:mRNA interferase MazF